MSNWQRLDTTIVYQNSYLTIHEDNVITPQGKPMKYSWVETSPAVYVVAIEDKNKVILVKQLRYTTGQPTWELPGGGTGGQDVLETGKRELEAKAGFHADKWVTLSGDYYAFGGVATQRNTVLIARDIHKSKTGVQAGDSIVGAIQSFTWIELKEMMKTGELNDGESITALTLAGLHLEQLK